MIKLYTFFSINVNREDLVHIFIMSETKVDGNKIYNKLTTKFNNISNIKSEQYANLTFYVIIIGMMLFFIYILLSNLYSILKVHASLNDDSKRRSYRRNRLNVLYTDNNTFDDDVSFMEKSNYNEYIVRS